MKHDVKRLEQDGMYNEPSDHFEFFHAKVCIYIKPHKT